MGLRSFFGAAMLIFLGGGASASTIFSFEGPAYQPRIMLGVESLASRARISFELDGDRLIAGSYEVHGYTGKFVDLRVSEFVTYVRPGVSFGLDISFTIDPNTPEWVCSPYPYCGAVDSHMMDGMPLEPDLNALSLKVSGFSARSAGAGVREADLIAWMDGQSGTRVALDYVFVSLAKTVRHLGGFEEGGAFDYRAAPPPAPKISPVPLPASALLLLAGLGLLRLRGRA